MKRQDLEPGVADIYYGASCLTTYWVHDDEHKCIAYNKFFIADKDQKGPKGYFKETYPWDATNPWYKA